MPQDAHNLTEQEEDELLQLFCEYLAKMSSDKQVKLLEEMGVVKEVYRWLVEQN